MAQLHHSIASFLGGSIGLAAIRVRKPVVSPLCSPISRVRGKMGFSSHTYASPLSGWLDRKTIGPIKYSASAVLQTHPETVNEKANIMHPQQTFRICCSSGSLGRSLFTTRSLRCFPEEISGNCSQDACGGGKLFVNLYENDK